MRVGIIGAGIGGLVTALGLQRYGAEVTVFERSDGPRPSGSGLSVFGNGWTALDAVGVGPAARAIGGAQVAGLQAGQRRPDGRWLATNSAQAISPLRIVHRAELHQILCDFLAPDVIRYGSQVEGVDLADARVDVVGTDGTRTNESFDVVVGADGIHSMVRAQWPDDPGTRYSGYSSWRGITRGPVDLLDAAGETWGRGLRFGYAPLRDGRVYWFGVATMPKDTVIDDEYRRVVDLFAGWHQPIGDIVEATDPGVVFRLPIEDLARPLTSFRHGRTVCWATLPMQ